MNASTTPILDAALDVFLRYGFKRTTMGDIAKTANLSRPSLYARYANKDEVYAAVFAAHIEKMLSTLNIAWADCDTLSGKMDCLWDHSVLPSFEMLTQHPDASDIIEGVETVAGQAAMEAATQLMTETLAELLAPYNDILEHHGQTPEKLAEFIDQSKHMMLRTAKTKDELVKKFSTLKAATLALTSKG